MKRKQRSIHIVPLATMPLLNERIWLLARSEALHSQTIKPWPRQLLLAGIVVLLALTLTHLPAQAAAITADGTTCTLVDAITAANTDTATGGCAAGSGTDTITLTSDVMLTTANNGDNGLPIINSVITIEGAGYTIARDAAAPSFRLLEVGGGGNLTLNNATITGGNTTNQFGGGGIYISETGLLTLSNSTISGNTASGLMSSTGGGIANYGGTLIVINSTISGNTAAEGMMDAGYGGGIYNSTFNASPANVTLTNSTITGNTAVGGFNPQGGGIYAYNGTVTLVRTLVAGNLLTGSGLGNHYEIANYIGTINGNNYNLIGYSSDARSSGFTPSGTDLVPSVGLTAILNPTLADNDGDTFTHALVGGSPAINAAMDSGLATDQRGVVRPQGIADDIGAFEWEPEVQLNGTDCGLVDAITAANTDTMTGACAAGSGADTITLLRDVALAVANNGNNGLPIITSVITIEGDGYTVKRDASAGNFRIMEVGATGNLTLNEATISGGSLIVFDQGGAIASAGILQINNSTLTDNHAGIAGALTASGVTTITNSTISGNSSITFGAGGFGNSGTMALFNTTVTGNTAANLGGGFDNGGTLTLNRSLIAGNMSGFPREFRNTGTINANNYNLIGYSGDSGTGGFTPSGTDIVPTVGIADILNTTLGDNGGSSFTHALVDGSPAIDAATDSSLATDQRGVARPQGLADDIGAFEAPTLLALGVDIGALTPSFDSNITSYTATVGNAVSSVSITPTVSEINASTIVTVTPPGGTPITCMGNPINCPLAVGDNVVEIHVTTPDGTIAKTYTTTITRAPSSDATLSGLSIGVGTLTPSFDANVITYTAMVSNATDSVSITPTVGEINASTIVTVTPAGGTPITCTGNPIDCPLAVGDNAIVVTVTAQDGTIKTYTTVVTRPSTDATLSTLSIGTGTLTPSFDANITNYTTTVDNVTSSVSVNPGTNEGNATTMVTVTPPGGTPITCTGNPIDCPLAVGDNVIVVTVTAQDGTTTQTYTTTVTRAPSSDATLSTLAIGGGVLTPNFNPATTSYTTLVGNATSSINVTSATNEGNANTVVTVTPPGGTPIICTSDPVDCPLAEGDNVLEVTVTAQDGTIKIYTIIITRKPLDTDGDGIPNSFDQDDDGDGIPDSVEGNGAVDTDGDGIPDSLDLDSDNDGINDVREVGGLTDGNGDGKADGTINANGIIANPVTTPADTDNDGTPDYRDLDSDGDGISDLLESATTGLIDTNNDSVVDGPDNDGDGIQQSADGNDEGVGDNNDPALADTDGDGIPNAFDNDSDNDGKRDQSEGTGDIDGDGIPNYADANDNDGPLGDMDGDGLTNGREGGAQIDTDGDGIPNYLDADDDGDGILTKDEDINQDGNLDNDDSNGNGIPDYLDMNGRTYVYWLPVISRTSQVINATDK